MITKKNYRIVTYKQAFEDVLGIDFDEKIQKFVKGLEEDGHTEKSISFAIWRTKETLLNHVKEDYFLSMLKTEILKYSWSKDNPKWKEYNKIKETEQQINEFVNNAERLEFVYFIQGENGGPIRIGCTVNPIFRLKSLQKGYPDKLKLLLVISAPFTASEEIKKAFKKHKLKGDWFKPDEEIFDEIELFKATYPHVVGD